MTAACSTATIPAATETERAIVRGYERVMPTRSRADTERTQAEIGRLYDWHCRRATAAGLSSAYCPPEG